MCRSLTGLLRLLALLHVSVSLPTGAVSGASGLDTTACRNQRLDYGHPVPLGDITQREVRQHIVQKCAGSYEHSIKPPDGRQQQKEIILLLASHQWPQVSILHNFVAQLRLLGREHYVVVRDGPKKAVYLLLPAEAL